MGSLKPMSVSGRSPADRDGVQLSIVIPVYNAGLLAAPLCRRLKDVVGGIPVASFEIILVDDCSPDQETWPALVGCAEEFAEVRAIRLTRNVGQQLATICGLQHSSGRHVLTMDDDGQHRPEDIPLLWAERAHDIAIAQFRVKRHGWFKRLTSRVKKRFDELILGKPKDIQLSSFRLLSRPVVEGILGARTASPFIPALMFAVSSDVIGVEATHERRLGGTSGYSFPKRFSVFANLLINNSALPLRFIGGIGITVAMLSALFASKLVFDRIVSEAIAPGWTSVMVTVLFIGGLLLFSVGLIGEYLVRTISSVERPRRYHVREIVGEPSDQDCPGS